MIVVITVMDIMTGAHCVRILLADYEPLDAPNVLFKFFHTFNTPRDCVCECVL